MAAKVLDWKVGTGQTVGAVTADLVTIDLTNYDNSVVNIDAMLVGRTAAGNVAVAEEQITAKRQAGTVSVVTANSLVPFSSGSSGALIGATISENVAGNVITIRAGGVLAETIEWMASVKITIYQN